MTRALLISTYEMGRQSFGLASSAAWLRAAGVDVVCVDLSRDRLPDEAVAAADLVGWYLPMHTATRLAVPVVRRVRAVNRHAHLCAFGLYAPLNDRLLRSLGIDTVLGGEFEADLTALAARGESPASQPVKPSPAASLPRLRFRVPDRRGLPSLDRYASLQEPAGSRRRVGYTEASRGCKHLCRHCPVVPVYQGRFRVVPVDVVLADVAAQVEAGARHITFGDPDFFNGIGHASKVVRRLAASFPEVTYDVTIKIEHLLRHAAYLPMLNQTGCAFVTSAAESIDDRVLRALDKGHTREDFERAVEMCRASDVVIVPTFVAFTPWTTLDGYCGLLEAIRSLDLVEATGPIQLALRLLLPERSGLLEHPDIASVTGPFDPESLVYPWRHPDPRVDALQAEVIALVGRRPSASRRELFAEVWQLSHERTGRAAGVPSVPDVPVRAAIPYLNEPWYC